MTIAAIIPAAGSGTRMQLDHPKQFHKLGNAPILLHAVTPFVNHPEIDRVVVVVPADRLEETTLLLAGVGCGKTLVTPGGRRRQDSVKAGLDQLDQATEIVLVHDGARPFVTRQIISRCIEAARTHGAAIAAVPVKDTLKRGDRDRMISSTVDRKNMWLAHTPQAARFAFIQEGYRIVGERDVTDESMLLELAGHRVFLVESDETNIKITRPEDLRLAGKIMEQPTSLRIGHGYDAHRLVEGRTLVLGGVEIPYHLGLAGHSDADVLTHALCDALLGALGRGDIGRHFPDSDPGFAGIYSIRLLERVVEQVETEGYTLGNADITVVCQAPKLAPHLPQMRRVLATACRSAETAINIKATTTEKMGFTGRGEGISSHAVVLLQQRQI